MKCMIHTSEDAVGTCAKCGAGLCSSCFASSEYTFNNKPMCANCNLATIKELYGDAKSEARAHMIRLIINAIFVGCGVASYMQTHEVIQYFGIAALGAFPAMWRATKPTLKEQVTEAVQEASGDFSGTFIGLIIRIILCFVFGGIVAPFTIIFSFFKYLGAHNRAGKLSNEIETFRTV